MLRGCQDRQERPRVRSRNQACGARVNVPWLAVSCGIVRAQDKFPLSWLAGAVVVNPTCGQKWLGCECRLSTRLLTPTTEPPASAIGRSATIDWTLGPKSPRRGGQRPTAVSRGRHASVRCSDVSRPQYSAPIVQRAPGKTLPDRSHASDAQFRGRSQFPGLWKDDHDPG